MIVWMWIIFSAVSYAFIGTGHFLPLPQVTGVQRHSEEGTKS